MTPEQRLKIQALRKGQQYVPVPDEHHVRDIPKSIQNIKNTVNFKRLFKQINAK
jgi:hypothetical protein